MENKTVQAASEKAAFVLHDMAAPELWQIVRILRHINLQAAMKNIDQELWQRSQFDAPTMISDDGDRVPLPEEKWTKAQKKARDAAKAANDELTWSLLAVLMDHIGDCEADVNKLLAMGIRQDPEVFREMPVEQYTDLLVGYFTRDAFSDFFMRAYSLVKKTGA